MSSQTYSGLPRRVRSLPAVLAVGLLLGLACSGEGAAGTSTGDGGITTDGAASNQGDGPGAGAGGLGSGQGGMVVVGGGGAGGAGTGSGGTSGPSMGGAMMT